MTKKLFKLMTIILIIALLVPPFVNAADVVSSYSLNDKHYAKQTNLSQVFAQFAWERAVFGEGVRVAVIDSGLYNSASDFHFSKIFKVKDYTDTASSPNTFCADESGHGSIATGIIAAAHNNNRGIAGIAPYAEIYIFKCAYINDKGYEVAPVEDVIDAIKSAIDDYDCHIINLSVGLTTDYPRLKSIVDYAEEKGVLLVAAAGNDGSMTSNVYYPASYDSVISVGSVKADGHKANHSQRNNYVNIMAPGEDIYSVTKGGYAAGTGTSFAAPHVTAAAALAKSLNPSLTAKELREALYSTATPMKDRFSGHGLLNIQSLLTYVSSTLSPGEVIYSTNGSNTCSYFSAPDGFIIYAPTYENDILTSVSTFSTVPYTAEDFKNYYIWHKTTLTPWEGEIIQEEY